MEAGEENLVEVIGDVSKGIKAEERERGCGMPSVVVVCS